MASFKMMHSSNSRNSDRISSSIRPPQFWQDLNADQSTICDGYGDEYDYNTMTVEGILHDTFESDPPSTESTLLDVSLNLMDAPVPMEMTTISEVDLNNVVETEIRGKSDDEVWREIVSAEGKRMKEETQGGIMTLEDFLAKTAMEDAATVVNGGESDDLDVKIPPERLNYGFENSATSQNPFQMIDKVEGAIVAFGNGLDVYGGGARGKRARLMVEPLDKAAAQKQRRMIKNRESAARSRERKQAYQMELEAKASKLEEENEMLAKNIAEMKKERYRKLTESVIPVVEQPNQPKLLRRVRSLEW